MGTGFTCGPVNGRHAYIPIACVTETPNRVKITDRMWARLLSSTNQPSFIKSKEIMEAKRQKESTKMIENLDNQGKGLSGKQVETALENKIKEKREAKRIFLQLFICKCRNFCLQFLKGR